MGKVCQECVSPVPADITEALMQGWCHLLGMVFDRRYDTGHNNLSPQQECEECGEDNEYVLRATLIARPLNI